MNIQSLGSEPRRSDIYVANSLTWISVGGNTRDSFMSGRCGGVVDSGLPELLRLHGYYFNVGTLSVSSAREVG